MKTATVDQTIDDLTVSPTQINWTHRNKSGSTVMKVSDLAHLHISCYSVSDPDSPAPRKHGYQRDPDKKRFPEIGKYYYEGTNYHYIPPIVVSVRLSKEADIKKFEKLFAYQDFDEIKSIFNEGTVSIIDGQHRSLGLLWAYEKDPALNPEVTVQLFFGLSFIEEAQMFDKINSTQKKLPKALIEVTKGDITEANDQTHPQQIRELSFGLARDDDSVWYEQVNMTGARDPNRYITYEGLRRSTSNMFTAEVLSSIRARNEDALEDYAKPYWEQVSEACSEAWIGETTRTIVDPDTGKTTEEQIKYRIKELVGVASLARLGQDIIKATIVRKEVQPDVSISEIMTHYTDKLSQVNWEKDKVHNVWMKSQAGFAGQSELFQMLHNLVFNDQAPDDVNN